MSGRATIWASQQHPQRPADKLVLWGMADAARDQLLCFASVASITEFTGLDRKTVLAAQARLKADGLIVDTGDRRGDTRQIIVWSLPVPDEDDNSPKNGTVPKTEQSQKRNSPENDGEQSQKRDTEPPYEPPIGSEASPPQRGGAKTYNSVVIFDAWNAMAAGCLAHRADKLTEKRRTALRCRIDDYTEKIIMEAIADVPAKPWLMGENDRNWTADFDWLLKPDSITRLREGKYDHGQRKRAANDTGARRGDGRFRDPLLNHYDRTGGVD